MSSKKATPTPYSKGVNPSLDAAREAMIEDLVDALDREIDSQLGPNATFEERQNASFEIAREALRRREEREMRGAVTSADEVEVEGKRYRRLSQRSSGTYFGRWGSHRIDESLYREVGVRNGPTIKPVELRLGIVSHMTPDFARVVGALSADDSSRSLQRVLTAVGLHVPSRAFLADRLTELGTEVADRAALLEAAARALHTLPEGIASVSCGLDRMSVRMAEEVESPSADRKVRQEPYERQPPPPHEYHYRKAWVGSTSVYDEAGRELATWRFAMEADGEPDTLAQRVVAEVSTVLDQCPGIPVTCVQDAAPELRVLPATLRSMLPSGDDIIELVDFEHLAGYLDAVQDAADPSDPFNMKHWYRSELLTDDRAIDRIQRNLRAQARRLPRDESHAAQRAALAKALRYIKTRKNKMRYASHHQANRAIGSGATESTCWLMQQRIKLPGQSWETEGLRGVLGIRSLVLSERWDGAWTAIAATHRKSVVEMSS